MVPVQRRPRCDPEDLGRRPRHPRRSPRGCVRWALEIDDAHNLDYPAGTTFHPTFLYESLWNLGLVALLLWIDRRLKLGPGRLFAVYLAGYGAGRFWIEGLRIDPTEASDVAGLRWNQWVALAAVVAGAVWLLRTRGSRWPDSPVDAGGEPSEPDGAFPELLGVMGDPAGDPGDREDRRIGGESADVDERAQREIDVGQVPDDPPGLGDD